MSALTVITSLMPVIKAAAETIELFQGDEQAARTDSTVQNALEVLGAAFPLIDTFRKGGNVTEEDAQKALAANDEALADFDAEIARQDTTGQA